MSTTAESAAWLALPWSSATHQPRSHRRCAGTIGHVAHGKSTVVKAISGVQTVRFKNELERNITIKLGYANAKIYKCERRVGAANAAGTEGCAGANQRWHARAALLAPPRWLHGAPRRTGSCGHSMLLDTCAQLLALLLPARQTTLAHCPGAGADPRCPRPACYKAYGSSKEDNPKCDVPGAHTALWLQQNKLWRPAALLVLSWALATLCSRMAPWAPPAASSSALSEHAAPAAPPLPPGFEDAEMELVRHVSFVDCPGHDILMATMLNGAAVMDGAMLLIAANEPCPQPQTSEHLAAVEIMRLQHIIILQVRHLGRRLGRGQGC